MNQLKKRKLARRYRSNCRKIKNTMAIASATNADFVYVKISKINFRHFKFNAKKHLLGSGYSSYMSCLGFGTASINELIRTYRRLFNKPMLLINDVREQAIIAFDNHESMMLFNMNITVSKMFNGDDTFARSIFTIVIINSILVGEPSWISIRRLPTRK